MVFDKCKVYHTLNASSLKVGSKIFVADTLEALRTKVRCGTDLCTLENVLTEDCEYRFDVGPAPYALAYLVEEPAKLKWTDLKVGDVIHRKGMIRMVIGIDSDTSDMHILINNRWLDDEELAEWEKVEQ